VLHRRDAGPLVTNDGVTIANAIERLRDPYSNQGVQLLREVASVTDRVAGDGTSTAVIMARELLRQAFAALGRGDDRALLCDELRAGLAAATTFIRGAARPVTDSAELAAVAGNAARDASIGRMIAQALSRVGEDGVINVDDDSTYGIRLEFSDGMSFDEGLLAPDLALDKVKRQTAFERPFVLLASERIRTAEQVAPALRLVAARRVPLVIIADEVSGEALATLVLNARKRALPTAAVKAPLFGEDRLAMLGDIAALTGGRVLGPGTGISVRNATVGDLGIADRITVTSRQTTISGGHGDERGINTRLARIAAELGYLESEYERAKRRVRRACLNGTVASIKVGLDTSTEQEETRLRVIDGIRSARGALRGGVVPGGGATLAHAAQCLSAESEHTGFSRGRILARALEAPARQLAFNAGLEPSVALDEVRAAGPGFGLDLRSRKLTNLRQSGVIDAAEVICTAVEVSVSIALTALLTEVIVAERPLPAFKKRPHGHHHGHDHGHSGVGPGHANSRHQQDHRAPAALGS
jgi:chaperonin GroEL